MLEKEITFDRFIRGLITIAVLVLIIYTVKTLSSVLLPFFIAWFLAYMMYPMVKFFQDKLRFRSRILSIITSLLIVLVTITGFLWLIIPPVISEFMRFRTLVAQFFRQTGNTTIGTAIENYFQQNFDQNTLVQLLTESNVTQALGEAVSQMWNLMSYTLDALFAVLTFLLVLLYLFFILIDYEKMYTGWLQLVPKRNRHFAAELMNDVQHGMNSYFRGQALVALCVGILFSIGFLIIDFPLAIALGMFIGFLNLVPYLQAVGFLPTILLALLKAYDTGGNFWLILLGALAVFAIVQTIQDTVLVPKIMGKIMGLKPAVILLALSVWGLLLGLIGLIIALPLTTLLLSYYRRFIQQDEIKYDEQQKKITHA